MLTILALGTIELLPPLPAFLAFAVAGLLLNLVPGQDMLFVMVNAARARRAGVVAALGIGAGAFVHILAAAIGVSAVIAASERAFTILKILGVGYLLWLAASMVRRGPAKSGTSSPAPVKDRDVFQRAALVNITNPKVALFFLAFLPQFVSPGARIPALEILCLGLWFDAVGTFVNVVVALVANAVARRAGEIRPLRNLARWLAASALTLIAARLAFAQRG